MTTHRHSITPLWTALCAVLLPNSHTSAFLPTPPLSLHHPHASPQQRNNLPPTNSYLDTLAAADVGGGIASYLDSLSPPPTASGADGTKGSYLDTLSGLSLSYDGPSAVVVHDDAPSVPEPVVERETAPSPPAPSPPTDDVSEADDDVTTTPVFDFTGAEDGKARSLASFDRIDDAIMGGISLSSLRDPGEGVPYASWSGICRTEGGGFCGFRTLPFLSPLPTAGQSGIYIDCRLASDDEPRRRVWKMTLRTQAKRTTEVVYQAEFDLGVDGDDEGWSRVTVPFDSFQLVRGPRLVPDMPPADVSEGIFQIGVSLSKFVMGVNMTELPDFRPGYFDLQIGSIGFFNDIAEGSQTAAAAAATPTPAEETTLPTIPETVTKAEADKSRPLPFRLLSPLLNFLFSEKSRRRRTAMKILTETRGMSRRAAVLFGIRSRSKGGVWGTMGSVVKTVGIVGQDVARTVLTKGLKLSVFYPVRFLFRAVRMVKGLFGGVETGETPSTE